MEPYKAKMLPIPYKLDKETIKLLGQANDKYGQYKSLLKMFKFDQKYFLDSLVLGESIRVLKYLKMICITWIIKNLMIVLKKLKI